MAKGGEAAVGVCLDGAGGDAEGIGDLGLAEVGVVAQREHLALAPGQPAEGGDEVRAARAGDRAVLGARLGGEAVGGPRRRLREQLAVLDRAVTQDRA